MTTRRDWRASASDKFSRDRFFLPLPDRRKGGELGLVAVVTEWGPSEGSPASAPTSPQVTDPNRLLDINELSLIDYLCCHTFDFFLSFVL